MKLLEQILGKEKYEQIKGKLDVQLQEKNKKAEELLQKNKKKGQLMMDYLTTLYNDEVIQDYIAMNGSLRVFENQNRGYLEFGNGIYYASYVSTLRAERFQLDGREKDEDYSLLKLSENIKLDIDKFKAEVAKTISDKIEERVIKEKVAI
jgi:hypothetical protein